MLYIIKVEKMCEAVITVEAESEEQAKEKAEFHKYNMVLGWK